MYRGLVVFHLKPIWRAGGIFSEPANAFARAAEPYIHVEARSDKDLFALRRGCLALSGVACQNSHGVW